MFRLDVCDSHGLKENWRDTTLALSFVMRVVTGGWITPFTSLLILFQVSIGGGDCLKSGDLSTRLEAYKKNTYFIM